MDTLDEALSVLEAESRGAKPCPVAQLLTDLKPDTAARLQRVLDGNQSTRKIHAELAAAGVRIGRDSLSAHRAGWCRCQKAVTA